VNCEFTDEFDWPQTLATAWGAAESGDMDIARRLYGLAEDILPNPLSVSPELSILRHARGSGTGQVICVPPTEDKVFSIYMIGVQEADGVGPETFRYTPASLEAGIRKFMSGFDGGYHSDNIREDRRHVFVMSTGRCGTVSLYRLFSGSNIHPFHTFWFHPSIGFATEFLARLVSGEWSDDSSCRMWMKCRAAEWLGDKRCMFVNHTDTAFAPVFAALHPSSVFIHLKRNPEDVYRSFHEKGQYGLSNLGPFTYVPGREFAWARTQEDGLEWFIRFTEDYANAMSRVLGDRVLNVSSDRLFAQDREEIARLLKFTGSDIDLDFAVAHFARKINEKAHKAV